MSELLLKVGTVDAQNKAVYQDGDILCAFNNRRIHQVHAENICHIKNVNFTSEGLNPSGCITKVALFENMYQYRFERISSKEVKRITIADGKEETFSDKTEKQIYVEEFLDRRIKNKNHCIFGLKGSELWYGGRLNQSITAIGNVWDKIEEITSNVRTDFTKFPLGIGDKKSHLPITVNDFDETEAKDFVKLEEDRTDPENIIILQKRIRLVDYINDVGLKSTDIDNINDETKEVDFRDTISITKTTDIKTKTLIKK